MVPSPPRDITKSYGPKKWYHPVTITPRNEPNYEERVAVVSGGVFFEYLAAPQNDRDRENSVPLLAIHKPGCVIGVGYRQGWPEDLRLDTAQGRLFLRVREDADYTAELERQARSTAQSLRLNLKPVEARIVAGIYLLGQFDAAYTSVVGRVMGIRRETVSRNLTKLIRKGVVVSRERNVQSPITLCDGALERYGLSAEELSDLVHEC